MADLLLAAVERERIACAHVCKEYVYGLDPERGVNRVTIEVAEHLAKRIGRR